MSSATWTRLSAMIVKEFWALLRDPRGRITLIVPPLVQLFLFGFAATLEVKNVTVGVYDRDRGGYSQEVISRLAGSPNIKRIVRLDSPAAVADALDNQRAIAVVAFDDTFSRDVAAGRTATVQALYDGRRSNAAQIVNGYVGQIIGSFGAELHTRSGQAATGSTYIANWFNPNLDYRWFTMPSLIVMIGALSVLSVTGQSIARERELGTFDQLMVSPFRIWEMLVGKMAPALGLGVFNATVYLILIPLAFGVPFRGQVWLFYLGVVCYLTALIGLGLLISIIARTQQQAFLGMFLSVIPLVMISGFASPLDNMPGWLQMVAQVDPLKHFLIVSEGLFLKGMPAADVFANIWPLLIIACATIAGSTLLFRARME